MKKRGSEKPWPQDRKPTDTEDARQTMEERALPLLQAKQFSSNVLGVRAQYAVVLAY